MVSVLLNNVSVHYGAAPVLWDISFQVPKGRLVGIMGPNGAGKSTLMKAMLGLIPASGRVVLLGEEKRKLVRSRIAYVPQKEHVDWDFPITVRELVLMGAYPKRGLFRRLQPSDYEAVDRALDLMGLSALEHRQISQLSGGQQQRAFLARAIVQDADLYFLDEPFAGVDVTSEHLIVNVLKTLEKSGKTIFVVHHDLAVCREYFSWLLLLNTRLIAAGPTSSVFSRNNLRLAYGRNWQLAEEAMKVSMKQYEGEGEEGGEREEK